MRVVIYILPVLFAVLFGIFDAAQTVRKDFPAQSVFWEHSEQDWAFITEHYRNGDFRAQVMRGATKFDRFDLWYVGGNEFYSPPKYFWTGDFWHAMKALWVLCISGIGLSCLWVGYLLGTEVTRSGWKRRHLAFGVYVFLYWVEGGTFALFYHHLFLK